MFQPPRSPDHGRYRGDRHSAVAHISYAAAGLDISVFLPVEISQVIGQSKCSSPEGALEEPVLTYDSQCHAAVLSRTFCLNSLLDYVNDQ